MVLAGAALTAQARCPALLVERFIPADCETCWRDATVTAAGNAVLDWIVPVAQGDDAALAAAALPESARRAAGSKDATTLTRHHALASRGLTVQVDDGPAWNAYMGAALSVRRGASPVPAGAQGYLALVETVLPGEEATPVTRRVLRVLAGPLSIDPALARVDHLLALRLPQGARGDRLGVVGWVEDASGRVLAVAEAGQGPCPR